MFACAVTCVTPSGYNSLTFRCGGVDNRWYYLPVFDGINTFFDLWFLDSNNKIYEASDFRLKILGGGFSNPNYYQFQRGGNFIYDKLNKYKFDLDSGSVSYGISKEALLGSRLDFVFYGVDSDDLGLKFYIRPYLRGKNLNQSWSGKSKLGGLRSIIIDDSNFPYTLSECKELINNKDSLFLFPHDYVKSYSLEGVFTEDLFNDFVYDTYNWGLIFSSNYIEKDDDSCVCSSLEDLNIVLSGVL